MGKVLQTNQVNFDFARHGFFRIASCHHPSASIFNMLSGAMSANDLDELKGIIAKGDAELGPSDVLRMVPVLHLMHEEESSWLKALIREERLLTAFQPIFDLKSGRVFAHECLMRGKMPDGAIVAPAKMIPLARKANLMHFLDRLAQMTAFRSAVKEGVKSHLFVNFNPSTVLGPNSISALLDHLLETNISPQQVVFEVTESEEVADVHNLIHIMSYYQEAGFKIALDDLGSGYNGLNLLSNLRPDFVKLDAGLIRQVDMDPFRQTIASQMLSLARKLNIRTVIEGIETEGELAWVMAQGADYGQGYLLGRPDFKKYPEDQVHPFIQPAAA
ncbi:MAG: EAL domain-containing protein [Armatimonadetes bacterium]|nr:EAL domain-containing protein [Armatimonadota bacterium]